jgi:superfamily II DNA or RNA helicase
MTTPKTTPKMKTSSESDRLAAHAIAKIKSNGTRPFVYQKSGIRYMLDRELGKRHIPSVRGGILADAPGLGKTLQIAGLIMARPMRTVFVCPPSIVHQTVAELRKFAGDSLRVYTDCTDCVDFSAGCWDDKSVLVISIAKFRSTKVSLERFGRPGRLVVDEAHSLRNPSSNTFVNIASLAERSAHVWLCTGTCMCNSVCDFVSLCRVLGLDIQACDAHYAYDRIVLRRTSEYARRFNTLLPGCEPPKVQIHGVDLSHTETHEYRRIESYVRRRIREGGPSQLGLLTTLRQAATIQNTTTASQTKFDAIAAFVASRARIAKVAVFYTFRREKRALLGLLGGDSACLCLDGSMSVRQKDDAIRAFRTGPINVMLVQVQSGCEGVNLQTASCIVFASPVYNPVVVIQAIARAYRTGQTRAVDAHMFVSRGTIEDRVSDVCADKARIIADLMRDASIRRTFVQVKI